MSRHLIRSACSLVIGLTLVRMFILYHDYLHQTIFKDSIVAGSLLKFYGHLMLTPPTIWRRTHDHHRHNSKIFGASIGSFPVMTTSGYLGASRAERLEYRMARSVWIIVFGYFTVFLFGMCLNPLLNDARRNLQVVGTLVLHFGAFLLSFICMGASFTLFACAIPTYIAMLSGAYLFYIQHNFPQAQVRSAQDWTYSDAALTASSFLKTGLVMRWFTGNIGFHHVHHLNAKIPFYRLPEAMNGLVGLQSPGCTSLSIADIFSCLRLKLWDTDLHKFVSFSGVNAILRRA
ncbi:MAG: fatty acid desaturase [Pirellulales bacterium]